MTSQPQDATLTILFSDFVDTTSGVLSRPDGERQMQEHYRRLDDLVDGHAGANAKWTATASEPASRSIEETIESVESS